MKVYRKVYWKVYEAYESVRKCVINSMKVYRKVYESVQKCMEMYRKVYWKVYEVCESVS